LPHELWTRLLLELIHLSISKPHFIDIYFGSHPLKERGKERVDL
jgi:hypothetical protein